MNELLAKSVENGGTLLLDHLNQVAFAAEAVARGIGCDENDIRLARYAGYLHDIGKAHPVFQARVQHQAIREFGEIPLRHEISSLLFLPIFPREDWEILVEYIVAHHKSIGVMDSDSHGDKGLVYLCNFNTADEVFERHSQEWDKWMPQAIEILNNCELPAKTISLESAREAFNFALDYCEQIVTSKRYGWSKRKGMFIAADHFASALIESTFSRGKTLFQKPDTSFFSRQHPLFPLSQHNAEDTRPHTLVKAPTGAGKTDFLMRRCKGRIFYTLPFQASINAMHERFAKAMPDNDVRLVHGSSSFRVDDREEKVLQGLVGSSVKVLTPHQLAALITGTRGFESIAIDVAGCDVILDEIHSYSDTSQSMVMEVVGVLKKLNCRIHIGTATMPTALESHIYDLLGGVESVLSVELDDETLSKFDRHRIFKHNSFNDTIPILNEMFNGSNLDKAMKCLVVCNRVDIAQERYELLKELFPYKKIKKLLIHSRFKRMDRAQKETDLMKLFEGNEPCLVVATQVVEVSLDISADIMITDCAPLDSLIQRFGRVHRKRSHETIGTYKPVHVIAPPEDRNSALPYKLEILQTSFEVLPDSDILHENDLQNKLNAVYPEVLVLDQSVHFIWKDDRFSMFELCHLPSSKLMEMLDIESKTVILQSDQLIYRKGNAEFRSSLEIPVPRSVNYKKFTQFGQEDSGSRPIIAHDELYSAEVGFQFREIDNFI